MITAAAACWPIFISIVLLNKPSATVEIFKLFVNINGVKNSTHASINAKINAAISPGLNNGNIMNDKSWKTEHPSIFAASSTSMGNLSIKVFKIHITKVVLSGSNK